MLIQISDHRRKIAYIFSLLFYISMFEPLLAAGKPASYYPKHYVDLNNNTTSPQLPDQVDEISPLPIKNKELEKQFIDGPGQPEMKSFQSVNANNMVDLFTGDFSYGIPLLDVEGYGVSLHYSSGITMDQEASWVGLGWNINPGTISRNMRGLPDDFDGINDSLKKTQSIKENKTVGVTLDPSLEIWGTEIKVSAKLGVFHNNYNGYGTETGVGIGGTGRLHSIGLLPTCRSVIIPRKAYGSILH
jgi:hypothetical protein